jgi:hypothetical protein
MSPRRAASSQADLRRMRRVSLAFRTARRQAAWIGVGALVLSFVSVGLSPERALLAVLVLGVGAALSWTTLRAGAAAGRRALREEQHWIATRRVDLVGFWDLLAAPLGDDDPPAEMPLQTPGLAISASLCFANEVPDLAELFERLLHGGIHQVRDVREIEGGVRLVMSLPHDHVDVELAPMIHRLIDGPLASITPAYQLERIELFLASSARAS